jgi:hypothetical protein
MLVCDSASSIVKDFIIAPPVDFGSFRRMPFLKGPAAGNKSDLRRDPAQS